MMIKPRWVKYRNMGGPLYRGKKEGNEFVHVYNPPEPWGVWTQVMGVVARCEGNFDTAVMYDETGVTFGFLQWTFKSGRLQKFLQFLKGITHYDFVDNSEDSVFDDFCVDKGGSQVFEEFGFRIVEGKFVSHSSGVLKMTNQVQRKTMVDTCMGRKNLLGKKDPKQFALDLCRLFAELGQYPEIQAAQIEFGKMEFKKSLDYVRPPLKDAGGTIRCLLPDEVWGSPIPAVFFNLFQNSPGGAFKLFKNAWKEAKNKGIATFGDGGYDVSFEKVENILEIIWRRLNNSSYADWGWKSRQYLSSGGKNPPRIKRIRPAIEEFYGHGYNLPFIK